MRLPKTVLRTQISKKYNIIYKYKLVIFDLDGTLINSVLDLAIATNYALQHYGYPQHPEDKYRYFVDNGVDMLLYRSLPDECKNDEWVKKMGVWVRSRK